MLYDNLAVNGKGHLTFAGYDTVQLAADFGTPAIFLDEERIRSRCREYKAAMADTMPAGSCPSYAGKAFSCKAICRIMAESWLMEPEFDPSRESDAFRRIQQSLEA